MSIAILEAYGINTDSDIKAVYYSIDEGLEKLTDGVIDATFLSPRHPHRVLQALLLPLL